MSNQSQTGDLLGRIFDRRYRVNELIGSGGMGSVYRATHLEMNREVALKVLERGVADTDKQVQRFYQEARASSRLQHPNTIRVFDFGRADDGRLYLAMEYLRGETLTELLCRQKRLSVDRSCHIIRQVCKSLAEAHQVGIIHRDLKPDNIFITDVYGERDFVKVLDFGIAKSTDTEGQESLTQTGFICGTPRYLSPEQAMGKPIDARSDLYSVGVMLYEMLSGHPPFAAATPIALVMKHIHEPPPKLPDGGRERAHWMSSLVFALMQKLPARRPPSSVIVAQALDDIAKGLQPAGVLQRGQSPAPRQTNRSRATSVIPNRRRSSTTIGNNQPATAALRIDKAAQALGERQLGRSNDIAPSSTTGRDAIVVDDPHDAVTNRGVVAMSDPDEEPTHISISAVVDPDEGPTNTTVSAMFEQDVEVTQFGMSVMVDPDEEPEQFGLLSADDTEDGPTDIGVSALPADIEFRIPADMESASSTLATQEDAMFRSSLVTGKRLEEEPELSAVAASN
ncbi:MAG: serine/threonine-protein kinase, partial [Myxococcota bacterium]|nr:serine/threonine-protein kinase [Myxococcota bacterium]